jgi:hypothetical protein
MMGYFFLAFGNRRLEQKYFIDKTLLGRYNNTVDVCDMEVMELEYFGFIHCPVGFQIFINVKCPVTFYLMNR